MTNVNPKPFKRTRIARYDPISRLHGTINSSKAQPNNDENKSNTNTNAIEMDI